jgi:hypothetical protein
MPKLGSGASSLASLLDGSTASELIPELARPDPKATKKPWPNLLQGPGSPGARPYGPPSGRLSSKRFSKPAGTLLGLPFCAPLPP